MPYPQGFQKAKLKFGSDTVECGFNPQDYTISKTKLGVNYGQSKLDLANGGDEIDIAVEIEITDGDSLPVRIRAVAAGETAWHPAAVAQVHAS